MRPMPPAGKLALAASAILLIIVFSALYASRAATLSAEERWKALPIEEKRQEWAAQCIVDGLPADPFLEDNMTSSIVSSCTDASLRLYPEPPIE